MMKTLSALGFAVLCLGAAAAPGAAADSTCAACHEKTDSPATLEHDFADWKGSVHARAGVACEACHGGNPAEADKTKAHKGIDASTHQSSPLYFTNIPETCGACHQDELKAFKGSAHSRALQRTGQGPNCVTCHGSMANTVMTGREMERTCTLCHRRPTQAYLARMRLDDSGATVEKLRVALRAAQDAGASRPDQESAVQELEKLQRAAVMDWHSFDMSKVLSESTDIKGRARKLLEELRPAEAGPSKR